jgi:hypothetical protein
MAQVHQGAPTIFAAVRLARLALMSVSDDYCDLCDLPRSQCIHGRPPPVPQETQKTEKPAPRPRKRATTAPRPPVVSAPKRVNRRWTSPEAFKPLIITALEQAGGALEADDLFLELEILAEDRLLPGDSETTPNGELRWRYAARRARVALIDEGLMTKDKPGVWQLARSRG